MISTVLDQDDFVKKTVQSVVTRCLDRGLCMEMGGDHVMVGMVFAIGGA